MALISKRLVQKGSPCAKVTSRWSLSIYVESVVEADVIRARHFWLCKRFEKCTRLISIVVAMQPLDPTLPKKISNCPHPSVVHYVPLLFTLFDHEFGAPKDTREEWSYR